MKIAALVPARKDSQRCKNKMLRHFAGTTLIDLVLDRLSRLEEVDAKYIAVNEDEFIKKAAGYPVTVIERSYESANVDGPPNKILEFLAEVPEDYILLINACNAFISVNTLDRAVRVFKENGYKSMTSVVKNRNWFYTLDGKPINHLDPTNTCTKSTPPLYEVIHAFHLFNRKYLLENNCYWTNEPDHPHLFEIPEEENFDIDTELEFTVFEKVYLEKKGKRGR